MNIKNIDSKNENLINCENNTKILHNANAYSFKVELSEQDNNSINTKENEDDLKEFLQEDTNDEKILKAEDALLIQNIQEMANKEFFRVKDSSPNLKLLIRTENLLKNSNKYDFDISDLESKDIDLFKKLSDSPKFTIQAINTDSQQLTIATQNEQMQVNYKSFDVSKTLLNLIDYANTTQKPVRLDFSGDSSVILRIDNEGKLSAHFLSSDAAMEFLLKSSIPGLRQKFDDQGLPYKELEYKQQRQRQNNHKQSNNKGE